MSVFEFLKEKEKYIYKEWLDLFLKDLGKEVASFVKREVDQFTNPLAFHLQESLKGILETLVGEFINSSVDVYLEKLAQIRAVQERKISSAVKLFIDLKGIIREKYGEEIIKRFGVGDLLRVEDRISAMMIRFLDYYQSYRERLYENRVEEFKRNNFLLLKRAGFIEGEFFFKNIRLERGEGYESDI